MFAADNPQIEQLFSASARDQNTIAFPIHDEIFGFHAQQAAEKLYKALITAHGEEHPFTHNLSKLTGQLTRLGEVLPSLPMNDDDLSVYGVEFRYEDGKPFADGEREALRLAIKRLDEFVHQRCQDLARQGVKVRNP